MNVLIIYATYSSGTQVASQLVAEELTKQHHLVVLKNAAKIEKEDFIPYDLIILASPSWLNNNKDGQPHHLFLELFDRMQEVSLNNKYFAIFGLGDSSYARFCGAVTHLEEFVKKINGKKMVDSLKIDGYYFHQEKNEQLLKDWLKKIPQSLS